MRQGYKRGDGKRREIVANERDRLRSQERKEIPFYTNSHFIPTREDGASKDASYALRQRAYIFANKRMCGIVASFILSVRDET